jgi:hypothetical protein
MPAVNTLRRPVCWSAAHHRMGCRVHGGRVGPGSQGSSASARAAGAPSGRSQRQLVMCMRPLVAAHAHAADHAPAARILKRPPAWGPLRSNEASMLLQTSAQGDRRTKAHWWLLNANEGHRAASPHQNFSKCRAPMVPAAKPSSSSPRATSECPSKHRGSNRASPCAAKRPSAKAGGRQQTELARTLRLRAMQQRQREGKRR